MTSLLQKIRLIPIVLFTAIGLFTLKVAGIVIDGGYTLGAGHQAIADRAAADPARRIQSAPQPVQQQAEQHGFGRVRDPLSNPDITGSVAAPKPQDTTASADPPKPKTIQKPTPKEPINGTLVQLEPPATVSPAERALLERLSERRQELDKRQNELEMRDTLLKASEKRLEARINELKDVEARIVAATQQKEEAEKERLRGLVTMYETMKAKDAAKIFDRLDMRLATDVAKLIQPRRMAEILSQMTPESAQRLTVALAANDREKEKAPRSNAELPKIEGRPNGS